MQKVEFNVQEMTSDHHKYNIIASLKALEGVLDTEVYLDKKTVMVVFDELVTNITRIINTITELGFKIDFTFSTIKVIADQKENS